MEFKFSSVSLTERFSEEIKKEKQIKINREQPIAFKISTSDVSLFINKPIAGVCVGVKCKLIAWQGSEFIIDTGMCTHDCFFCISIHLYSMLFQLSEKNVSQTTCKIAFFPLPNRVKSNGININFHNILNLNEKVKTFPYLFNIPLSFIFLPLVLPFSRDSVCY